MPRTKRYQNLQKSVQSVSSSQGEAQPFSTAESVPSLVDDAPQRTSFFQPVPSVKTTSQRARSIASQQAPSVQATSQPAPSVQVSSQRAQSIASQQAPSVQAASQPAPSVQVSSQRAQSIAPQQAPSVQAASQPAPSVQVSSQPAPSVQISSQPALSVQVASKQKRVGRMSPLYWTVDAIDSQGATRILRVKVKDVFNLPSGERIVVEFDDMDLGIGEAQGCLAGFCGILATDCSIFPIHFTKWSDLPVSYFNNCFNQIIKLRFYFRTNELNARHYVYDSIGRKWAAGRQRLWNEFFSPLKTKAQMMDNVPGGIPRDQWTSYVNYRYDEKTVKMCLRNAQIRKLQTAAHNGGSKPNSRRRAEMMAETGKKPGRAELYIVTHKYEDGSYVNEISREICEKIELAVSQSTTDESEVSPNDAVGVVLGKEHPGRVRCLGSGAVPSKVFKQTRPRFGGINTSSYENGSCSSQCYEKYNLILNAHNQSQENYTQMMTAHNQMMNAFKAYIISKEGTIPEQFAGVFVSPPHHASNLECYNTVDGTNDKTRGHQAKSVHTEKKHIRANSGRRS